jgi:TatD DNase family protein
MGSDVILRVTQIGKECHSGCSIMQKVGRCIMPKQGIFAVVAKGGVINVGDCLVAQKQRMAFSWLKT